MRSWTQDEVLEMLSRRNPEPRARVRNRSNDVVVGRVEGDHTAFKIDSSDSLPAGAINVVYAQDGRLHEVKSFKTHDDPVLWDQDNEFEVYPAHLPNNGYADGIAIVWGFYLANSSDPVEPLIFQASPVSDQFYFNRMTASRPAANPSRLDIAVNVIRVPIQGQNIEGKFISGHDISPGFQSRVVIGYTKVVNGVEEIHGSALTLGSSDVQQLNSGNLSTTHHGWIHRAQFHVTLPNAVVTDIANGVRHLSATLLVWGAQRETYAGDTRTTLISLETDTAAFS